jgi:hypothetical protein
VGPPSAQWVIQASTRFAVSWDVYHLLVHCRRFDRLLANDAADDRGKVISL